MRDPKCRLRTEGATAEKPNGAVRELSLSSMWLRVGLALFLQPLSPCWLLPPGPLLQVLAGTVFGWLWDLSELQMLLCKDIPYFFQAWQVIN